MFKKSYQLASKFTQPLIVALRFYDGTVESGLGSFIILNNEGWIITAAHNLNASFAYNQHQKEISDYEEKIKKIKSNSQLKESKRKSLLRNLKPNKKWVTDFMLWFGADGINIYENHVYRENDIAFLRIDTKHLKGFSAYPTIKVVTDDDLGTSLCKLGFPFYPVNATFNQKTRKFIFPPNLLPIPRFPIEGLYTRNIFAGKTKDGKLDIIYLETSTPGLKGQSGGPIFDVNGNIFAVQSVNNTIPLGFKGQIESKGRKIEENQFMNVGLGVHSRTIIHLLEKHKIKFNKI